MSARSGWRTFAGVMLVVAGLFNIFDGVVALFDTNYYLRIVQTSNGPQLVVSNNLHSWGWFALIIGIVMVCVAIAVFFVTTIGRIFGVVIAGVNMIFQFAFLPVFPLWALAMIIIDALVIYGLIARYESQSV